MNNPIAKFYSWQVNSGALDGWTSYHLAAGLFIAKVAQWLGATDFWAVMWVVIISSKVQKKPMAQKNAGLGILEPIYS